VKQTEISGENTNVLTHVLLVQPIVTKIKGVIVQVAWMIPHSLKNYLIIYKKTIVLI